MLRRRFNRFAEAISNFISTPYYFVGCILIVVLWSFSLFVIRDVDTWQLVINTGTTIITFWMVALLENSNRRGMNAVHLKLDRILEGMQELPDTTSEGLQEAVEAEKEID